MVSNVKQCVLFYCGVEAAKVTPRTCVSDLALSALSLSLSLCVCVCVCVCGLV